MRKLCDRFEREWEENPVAVIAVLALAATSAAKVMESLASVQSRRAYARQINNKTR